MEAVIKFCVTFWLLGCVLVCFSEAGVQPCGLKVFKENSENLTVADSCMLEFTSPECRPFVASFNRSLLPTEFGLTDEDYSIERPSQKGMDLNILETEYQENVFVPGVSVIFAPPFAKGSRVNVKGYLVIWEYPQQRKTFCRLFQFSEQKVLVEPADVKYQFDIPVVNPNSSYTVRVYSMPPPEDLQTSQDDQTFASMSFTSGQVVYETSDPGRWFPSLIAKPGNDGTFTVKIGRSPRTFNLTLFNVMLLKDYYQEKIFQQKALVMDMDTNANGVVTFSGLEPATYRAVVHVIDPFPKQSGKCLCWIQETNGRHCTNSCGAVSSPWLNVTMSDPTPPSDDEGSAEYGGPATQASLEEKKGDNNEAVLIAVVVCVSAAVVATVLFVFLYVRKRSGKS